MARNEIDRDKMEGAVERSLDDFIARANTTLPPATEAQAAALRAVTGSGKKKAKKVPAGKEKTLVVLGSQKPLAEETEIVSRLPRELLLAEEPRKSWFSLRLGLAFVAGAAAVLIITRLIAGSPEPVQPVAAPLAPPPTVTVPAPVVEPIPVPTPAPTPVATAPEEAAPAPAATEPSPTVRRRPARTAARPAAAPAPKKPSGLVDPFAQ